MADRLPRCPAGVFVDASLWYPPSSRALLLGIATAGAAEVFTSEQVLDELYRHLAVQIPEAALSRVNQIADILRGARTGSVVTYPL